MLKKIMMASLAVSALALSAPAATADGHLSGDCTLESVQQQETTGQTYQGGLAGYGVNSTGGPVEVHCEIRVGSETADVAAATAPGTGTGSAATAGQVSFTADDSETVYVCVVVSDGSSTYRRCDGATHSEFPPPGTWEQVDAALWAFWNVFDPLVCPELAKLAGTYPGGVVVEDDGDVWVNGVREFDCPVYDD